MLGALLQIVALPDALGKHACEECGHPEMRRLPDGTFHCPACGSEVLPIDASSTPSRPEEHAQAYWAGWVDGRFGERGSFVDNPNLARWENPSERLTYYQGHRAGSGAHRDRNSRNSDLCEKRLIGWAGSRWIVCDSRKEGSPWRTDEKIRKSPKEKRGATIRRFTSDDRNE
jgi:uncharacterized Zn finger protein (UPF0148 family)